MNTLSRIALIALMILAGCLLSQAGPTILFNDPDMISASYRCFVPDRDGYMWIGTESGLIRFDGVNTDLYRHSDADPNSISDDRINKIMIDRDGRVWVATANGLNLYHPESDSFESVPLSDLNFHGYVLDVIQKRDGQINFIVSGVSFYVVDETSGKPVGVRTLFNFDSQNEICTLGESSVGQLLIGTHRGKLLSVAKNGQVKSHQVTDTYFIGMVRDQGDHVLAYTTHDIIRWNTKNNTFARIETPEGVNLRFSSVNRDKDGSMFVSTLGDGIYKLKPGDTRLTKYPGLENSSVNLNNAKASAIYRDPNGNLWIGVQYRGIVLAPSRQLAFDFRDLHNTTPDFEGGINTVLANKTDDSMWISTQDGRLIHVDNRGKLLNEIQLPNGVHSMLRAKDGTIYVGLSSHGLYKINPPGTALTEVAPHKGVYDVPAIAEDSYGNIYASIHGLGISMINPSTGATRWIANEGNNELIYNNYVVSFLPDSQGRLWIGHYGGISCIDTQTGEGIDVSDLQDNIPESTCYAMAEGPDGLILVATNNGLLTYDLKTKKRQIFNTSNGLSNNNVNAIRIDKDNNAWLATMHGITKFSLYGNKATVYYAGNGLKDNRFRNITTLESDSLFAFSSQNGVTFFNPYKITPTKFEKTPAVTALYIHGAKVSGATESDGETVIRGNFSNIEDVNVAYHDNSLTFRLSTMDYHDGGNVSYEWQLEGVDQNWIALPTGQSTINIPHLQPGSYTLLIRACENGVYSDVKKVNIKVRNPWYLSIPAKIVYFLIFLGILYLIYILIKKRNDEKVNDEKIKFFINISHEIRSPMTLIMSPLETLMKREHDPETTAMLQTMHRSTGRILSLINQLLDIRKIDKGKMTISCSQTDLCQFVSELVDIFQPKAKEMDIKLHCDCRDVDSLYAWIDRKNFDKVLTNLITNALKYTPRGGEIAVEISSCKDSSLGRCAQIKVSDTGVGIDEKNLDKIFSRFYQAGTTSQYLGFGIGLDLCRQLVSLHHGTITAANRKDVQGSVFTVRIPLGHAHLSESEIADTEETPIHTIANDLNPNAIVGSPINLQDKPTGPYRIMVVDDDEELRKYIVGVLSRTYRVYQAADGAEALRMLVNQPVDVIVSDVIMPKMDGIALLKSVKGNVELNHVPIILLSTRAEAADRMAGWGHGADAYIGKPFNIHELQSVISGLISNRLRLRGKYTGVQTMAPEELQVDSKGNDEKLTDRLSEIITEHIADQNFNVEFLSDKVGVSRTHLHRKMKELFGMTPSDYIRNIRMNKACELLRRGDIDITQIAYRVGYQSQSNFSQTFKRIYGMAPTEYRDLYTVNAEKAEENVIS